VSEEKRAIKVTDKRMFTPEGELREEYRFLHEKSTEPSEGAEPQAPPMAESSPRALQDSPPVLSHERDDDLRHPSGPPLDLPGTPPELGGASFFDLIAMLAEPIAIYLGDVPLPDGQSAENLEMARLHIELLAVVRQKTRGNLSAQESAVLEDLLYRSQRRYVQRRG